LWYKIPNPFKESLMNLRRALFALVVVSVVSVASAAPATAGRDMAEGDADTDYDLTSSFFGFGGNLTGLFPVAQIVFPVAIPQPTSVTIKFTDQTSMLVVATQACPIVSYQVVGSTTTVTCSLPPGFVQGVDGGNNGLGWKVIFHLAAQPAVQIPVATGTPPSVTLNFLSSLPTTPAPPSLLLLITSLLAAGLFMSRQRIARLVAS
jgi:hypothetical protein